LVPTPFLFVVDGPSTSESERFNSSYDKKNISNDGKFISMRKFTVGFHERTTLDLNDGGERHKSRIIICTFEQIL
jgi:hypothetical protein